MTKEEYARISTYIHKGDDALKANDFDKFFQVMSAASATPDIIAEIYIFFVEELKMDPLKYMTVIPKKFFSKIPVTTLTIPSNIQELQPGAFRGNTAIEWIEFDPRSPIDNIPDDCFYGCRNLERIQLTERITFIDRDAFDGCEKVKIYVPQAAIDAGFRTANDMAEYKGKLKRF